MRGALVITVFLLAMAPFAVAQDHEHGPGEGIALVLHDGPDSGRAVVGSLTHFGFALLKDGMPQVHKNAEFRLLRGSDVLFQTNDTHEYDGIFSFDYTFTSPGPYTVEATSKGMMMGVFDGTAVLPVNETVAKVDAKVEPQPDARLAKVTLSIVDEAGRILPHTDAIVELRSAGEESLVARLHLHIHDAPIVFTQALPPFDMTMRVVAYKAFATGRGEDVRAVVADVPVKGAAPAAPNAPALPHAPSVLKPLGAKGEAGGYTLWASYDPEPQISPSQTIRLVGTILNASKSPQPHVDFDMTVFGPNGLLFSTKSLHEYDGVVEYQVQPFVPGFYEGTIVAHPDDGVDVTVPIQFEVVPPAVAVLPGEVEAGPALVTVKGLDKATAGAPTDLTFDVRGPQGPSQHSEVDVTIFHKGEAPIYQFKLHTHESGDTRATVVFPHAGEWLVRVDPLPTVPEPLLFHGPAGPGEPILFGAKVAGGGEASLPISKASVDGAKTVPGAGVALAVGAAACALLLARRR
jgi:hypothetical protein